MSVNVPPISAAILSFAGASMSAGLSRHRA
jgi:hypothetical protein